MNEGLLDRLIAEATAQGHRAWNHRGVWVFAIGKNLILCPTVPATTAERNRLLRDLAASGLLLPPHLRR